MSKTINSVTTTIGVAVVGALALGSVQANENPFGLTELDSGYMQLAMNAREGKCGAGKCGSDTKTGGDGTTEGKGKCGSTKTGGEGKCGATKTDGEGKCGAGKCGSSR